MSCRRRPLTLESVEDRCLPSGFRPVPAHGPPVAVVFGEDRSGPGHSDRFAFDDRRGPSRREDRPELVVRLVEAKPAFESQVVAADVPPRPPAVPVVLLGPRLVAPAPTPTARPDVAARAGPSTPASPPEVVASSTSSVVAPPRSVTIESPPTPPSAPTAPQFVAVALPAGVPASSPEPESVTPPAGAVEPPPAVVAVAQRVVEAVAPLLPLAGAVPVDLADVEQAASDLLARLVEGVEPAETTAGRWGWLGAVVVAAGGLVHTLRPAGDRRPAPPGTDSALARWESRHARRPG